VKIRFVLPLLFLLSMSAFAQTTYRVTSDSCGGKYNQLCSPIPVINTATLVTSSVAFDTRVASCCYFYLGGWGVDGHQGSYIPFAVNPDGTHNDFNGEALWNSYDGLVHAHLYYKAHYISICSGRDSTCKGWHYTTLTGSTIAVQ
jgi:hypothetical protein